MMENTPAYLPGSVSQQSTSRLFPLGRYLPPVPNGVGTAWLATALPANTEHRNNWVLDPFGASPELALEAARAGYRVLVAANNPVMHFLFEIAAHPIQENELRKAVAEFAAAHKGDERLEPHLRNLYLTQCESCRREIEAEAFIWERGGPAPVARIYSCPYCGDSGEYPAGKFDQARAAEWKAGGPHRARALQRIAPMDDPDRVHAEEALEAYPPRAIYALFSLINKLETISTSRRKVAEALLLAVFDQANVLWSQPGGRSRPRQLGIPPRYYESNVWMALENAVSAWRNTGLPPVQLTNWPDLPPAGGGICLFQGRVKTLHLGDSDVVIQAMLTALPRPNQAFWTLSALWAAWLWGREAAAHFKSVLRRRRYDWAWHSTALQNALGGAASVLKPGVPCLGLITEAEPGFLSAALIAGSLAGYALTGIAQRTADDLVQIHWRRGEEPATDQSADETGKSEEQTKEAAASEDELYTLMQNAGQSYLRERGEPSTYLDLHAAGLLALAAEPAKAGWSQAAESLSNTQSAFSHAFTYRARFLRFGGSEHALDVGLWWLRDPSPNEVNLPLSDRIEIALVRYLIQNPGSLFFQIENSLCTQFPGLFTPSRKLIEMILASYGVPDQPGSAQEAKWQLRTEDTPANRRADLNRMEQALAAMGERLGYHLDGSLQQQPIRWKDGEGHARYAFYLQASAVFGRVAFEPPQPPCRGVIVYPGSRAALAAYKMQGNPYLAAALEAGWRLVKFRHLLRMADDPLVQQQNLEQILRQDPVTSDDPQIALL